MMTPETALTAYITATNSHDFQNLRKIISDQAIYYFSDSICTTPEAIQAYFEAAWDFIKDEVYSISDIQWIHISDTSATCLYIYHYEGFIEGTFVKGFGKGTNLFVKENGQWRLLHEHLSSGIS